MKISLRPKTPPCLLALLLAGPVLTAPLEAQKKERPEPVPDTPSVLRPVTKSLAPMAVSRPVLVPEHLDGQEKMTFTATKSDDNQRQAAAFKVTLGVMPDYAYADQGMRIDAVLDGRPAQEGGLENGDIVLKIGDHEVNDIYDYMEALSKYEKGQKADVTVKRGKKKIKKSVTF